MTIVFDGRKLAKEKEGKLAVEVAKFKRKKGITPRLVSFLVGDDPASVLYTRIKQEAATRTGIEFQAEMFPAVCDLTSLLYRIKVDNEDSSIHGIMVQLPIKIQNSKIKNKKDSSKLKNIQIEILKSIKPEKDVDCLTPENLGLLMMGQPRFLPATVFGITKILEFAFTKGVDTDTPLRCDGKNVCIVGGSNIVGKPLAMILSNMGATVTICRSRTKDLAGHTRQADILISATGIPGLIKKEMVKSGAVVIDVGSPKGDVDFEVKDIASFITPVPGGVGPMTVISLLENTLQAARSSQQPQRIL